MISTFLYREVILTPDNKYLFAGPLEIFQR
jgi:hypothetical protein